MMRCNRQARQSSGRTEQESSGAYLQDDLLSSLFSAGAVLLKALMNLNSLACVSYKFLIILSKPLGPVRL